jgi:hypothetical protein
VRVQINDPNIIKPTIDINSILKVKNERNNMYKITGINIINGTEGCTLDKASIRSFLNILTVSSLLETKFFGIKIPI